MRINKDNNKKRLKYINYIEIYLKPYIHSDTRRHKQNKFKKSAGNLWKRLGTNSLF